MQIGFVGLGPMGEPMSRRLMDAGHTLVVYNRTASRAASLVEAGARQAGSPAEAARGCDLVFSMLANDEAVETLTFGENGILQGLPEGATHVGGSTISPALSTRLEAAHRERGQLYAAATVLGRPPAAAAGQLFIVLAGSKPARDAVGPILPLLGQRVFDLGDDAAKSNLLKLSLNFMIFSTIEQMGEVFALNDKGGIPPATVLDVLTNSFFTAPVHKNYGKLMVDENYDPPGGSVPLAAKDTKLLLATAEAMSVPLPMASLLRDRFLAMTAKGEAGLDFAALALRARDDAGL